MRPINENKLSSRLTSVGVHSSELTCLWVAAHWTDENHLCTTIAADPSCRTNERTMKKEKMTQPLIFIKSNIYSDVSTHNVLQKCTKINFRSHLTKTIFLK